MIEHFDKLHTPLRSIHQYPLLSNQELRFVHAGWHSVHARSLWELWSDPSFLTTEQRLALNKVEPFDEWEDFALFASHYFLLEASNASLYTSASLNGNSARRELTVIDHANSSPRQHRSLMNFSMHANHENNPSIHRRFGATVCISPGVIGHHGGLGSQGRINTTDVYRIDSIAYDRGVLPPGAIEARMCHTITRMGSGASLLVGGRTSPDHALSDCWLGREQAWERVDDLPSPIYRHCAANVTRSNGKEAVLIFGGRTNSKDALNHWFLWHDSTGWIPVTASGGTIPPRFGAAMASILPNKGTLFGGMAADGVIYQDMWQWEVVNVDATPSINLVERTDLFASLDINPRLLCRFGACLAQSSIGLLLIGGVSRSVLSDQFACIRFPDTLVDGGEVVEPDLQPLAISWDKSNHRPLLVGHSVSESCGSVIIIGGGANCFSFGTYWNQVVCTLQTGIDERPNWRLDNHRENEPGEVHPKERDGVKRSRFTEMSMADAVSRNPVRCICVETARDFERIVNNSRPVHMEGMDLGSCLVEWSFDALKVKMGKDRLVRLFVHHTCLSLTSLGCGS